MDEAKAAIRKNGKRKRTKAADATAAAGKAIDMAALISGAGMAEPGARLIVDMPLDGKGVFRLVLTEPGRRVTAWGSDMDEAMAQLGVKISG